MRPSRDEYAGDAALDRCGRTDGYHRNGEGRVIGYSAKIDDDTLRQSDRVPGSLGGSHPAVEQEPIRAHVAIAIMEFGCGAILCIASAGLVVVVVIQMWRMVMR